MGYVVSIMYNLQCINMSLYNDHTGDLSPVCSPDNVHFTSCFYTSCLQISHALSIISVESRFWHFLCFFQVCLYVWCLLCATIGQYYHEEGVGEWVEFTGGKRSL